MLNDLKTIHAELRAAIADLEKVVARPAPEEELLSAARLRLSRLSSRRRTCFNWSIIAAPPATWPPI